MKKLILMTVLAVVGAGFTAKADDSQLHQRLEMQKLTEPALPRIAQGPRDGAGQELIPVVLHQGKGQVLVVMIPKGAAKDTQ